MQNMQAWKAVVVNEISRKPANSLCSQTGSLSEKVQQRQQKCKLHILATVVVVAAVVCRLSKVAVKYTLHLNLYWFFGLSCHSYASTCGIFGNDFSVAKATEEEKERSRARGRGRNKLNDARLKATRSRYLLLSLSSVCQAIDKCRRMHIALESKLTKQSSRKGLRKLTRIKLN